MLAMTIHLADNGELDNWVTIFVVVGWLGFAFLTVMLIRERISRRQSQRPSGRQMLDDLKQRAGQQNANRDAATASPHDVQAAQDLAHRMDVKAQRLETLLDRAEAVTAELAGQLDRLDDYTRQHDARQHAPPPESADDTGDHVRPGGAAGDQQSAAHSTPDDRGPASRPVAPSDPLAMQIYELADQGHSPVGIAQQLDEQVGKVELILALRDS